VGQQAPGPRPLPRGVPAVTVSIGVATVCAGGEGIDELIAQADAALYTAKHAGRNCTRVVETDPTLPGKPPLRVIRGGT
jgi:GGDEF domain-containing protein